MERTLLFVTQVYPPDPAAVGQYMAEAAEEMHRRGFRVVVLTADRGYDDPRIRYPSRETRAGVEIVRLPLSSFGKGSIAKRLLGGFSFVAQAQLRGLLTRGLSGVVVTTVPPMLADVSVGSTG